LSNTGAAVTKKRIELDPDVFRVLPVAFPAIDMRPMTAQYSPVASSVMPLGKLNSDAWPHGHHIPESKLIYIASN
jgi:hypothetical protein